MKLFFQRTIIFLVQCLTLSLVSVPSVCNADFDKPKDSVLSRIRTGVWTGGFSALRAGAIAVGVMQLLVVVSENKLSGRDAAVSIAEKMCLGAAAHVWYGIKLGGCIGLLCNDVHEVKQSTKGIVAGSIYANEIAGSLVRGVMKPKSLSVSEVDWISRVIGAGIGYHLMVGSQSRSSGEKKSSVR